MSSNFRFYAKYNYNNMYLSKVKSVSLVTLSASTTNIQNKRPQTEFPKIATMQLKQEM